MLELAAHFVVVGLGQAQRLRELLALALVIERAQVFELGFGKKAQTAEPEQRREAADPEVVRELNAALLGISNQLAKIFS